MGASDVGHSPEWMVVKFDKRHAVKDPLGNAKRVEMEYCLLPHIRLVICTACVLAHDCSSLMKTVEFVSLSTATKENFILRSASVLHLNSSLDIPVLFRST